MSVNTKHEMMIETHYRCKCGKPMQDWDVFISHMADLTAEEIIDNVRKELKAKGVI